MVPYDRFANIYSRWVSAGGPVLDACRDFYVREFTASRGPAVELGVGNGRILVEAAKAGQRCLGVDYSQAMLDLARERAEAAGVLDRVTLLQGDFRTFELPGPVPLIAIPYDSIGHMVTDDARRACFRQVHRHLAHGGRFLLDQQLFTTDFLDRVDRRVLLRDAFVNPENGRECAVFNSMIQNRAEKRFRSFLWLEEADEQGFITRQSLGSVENSWIDPTDLRRLLEECGFEVEACLGAFDGRPFEPSATHQIWITRRA